MTKAAKVDPPCAACGQRPWPFGGRSIAFLLSGCLLNKVAGVEA